MGVAPMVETLKLALLEKLTVWHCGGWVMDNSTTVSVTTLLVTLPPLPVIMT